MHSIGLRTSSLNQIKSEEFIDSYGFMRFQNNTSRSIHEMKQKIMHCDNNDDASIEDGGGVGEGIEHTSGNTTDTKGTSNHLFHCEGWNLGILFKLKGTVILQIWWQILLVVIYTTSVVALDIAMPMEFTAALVPILGVVTGFLLVFRTNTAFDRYYEGRKIWTIMTHNVRIITRCVWIAMRSTESMSIEERKTIINFALAFPVAVKHYLRQEYSYDYDDLKDLIRNLRSFKDDSKEVRNTHSPISRHTNLRRSTRRYQIPPLCTSEEGELKNLPVEITYCIGIYINNLIERKLTDPSVVRTLNFALNGLTDCLGGLERILTTPIPLAYAVHLHHALWIHLLSLPFQLVSSLKWWTVPALGFTSFTLLGILAIGWEIENPFGYDYNDLPLDEFCKALRIEVEQIMQNKLPTYSDLFYSESDYNQVQGNNIPQSSAKPLNETHVQLNGQSQLGPCIVGLVGGTTKL